MGGSEGSTPFLLLRCGCLPREETGGHERSRIPLDALRRQKAFPRQMLFAPNCKATGSALRFHEAFCRRGQRLAEVRPELRRWGLNLVTVVIAQCFEPAPLVLRES